MAGGIYGLSGSGIDVDEMVKKMMTAKRVPYDTVYKNKTRAEWKKESYLSTYKEINNYRNDVFNYKLQSNLVKKTVNTGDGKVVSATANADTPNISHSIKVDQLAQSASITSKSEIGLKDDTDKKLTTLLGSTLGEMSLTFSDDKEGKNTKTLSYTKSELENKTIYDLTNDINKLGLNIKASYDSNLDRLFIYNKASGEENQININAQDDKGNYSYVGEKLMKGLKYTEDPARLGFSSDRKLSDLVPSGDPTKGLTLNIKNGDKTEQISFTAADYQTKTIEDLVAEINGKADFGVTAKYDKNTDQLYFYKKNTTQEISLEITGEATDNGEAFAKKLIYNQPSASSITTNLVNTGKLEDGKPVMASRFVAGQDASVEIDGMKITQKSNNFTVAGVNYSLQGKGEAQVQVNSDVTAGVETVKKFVESYNKMLESLMDKRDEVTYRDYDPLTKEERDELSEDQIKKWEEKAKSGLLRRDPILTSLINDMRNNVSKAVPGAGKYNSLASIGVKTGDYSSGGKLFIDETALKKSLEEDPDLLINLFSNAADTSGSGGVAGRLYDCLKTATDKITTAAGTPSTASIDTKSALARQITAYDKDLERKQDQLDRWETQYYNKFNNMENTLASLNNQLSYLTQSSSNG